MKKQNEKKSIVKTIKLSQNQYDYIQEQAAARNMNFSEYMIDCAVHGQKGLTPEIAVKAQSIANTALDLAERLSYDEYAAKEKLISQSAELSELFHVESPLDNYAGITSDIEKIAEGAESLWAYLK